MKRGLVRLELASGDWSWVVCAEQAMTTGAYHSTGALETVNKPE